MTQITGFHTFDVRFPTSRTLAGSDAMNPAPDYSAAYLVIRTDAPDPALSGHGFAFTIGRGNDVQLAAIRLLEPFLVGQDLDETLADLGGLAPLQRDDVGQARLDGLVETRLLPVIKFREHCITCFSCEIFCPEQIVDVHPSVKNRPRPW